MQTVAIVGVGLIGGSFALALRQHGFAGRILGVDESRFAIPASQAGLIDAPATLAEAAAFADLFYLSRSVEDILTDIAALGPILRNGALVTDSGSTKRAIAEQARRFLPRHQFLGGHPMSGKAVRGWEHSDPRLFTNRPYLVCDFSDANSRHVAFRDLLQSFGARVMEVTPEEHDHAVALTSHLPQLLSTALAATLEQQDQSLLEQVSGQGLIDMLRLAQSSPQLWESILGTNLDEIDSALDDFLATIESLRTDLRRSQIETTFARAQNFASRVQRPIYKS